MTQKDLKELFEYQMNAEEKKKIKEIADVYDKNLENCRLIFNNETLEFAFDNKIIFNDKEIWFCERLIYKQHEGYMVIAKIIVKELGKENIEYSMDPTVFPTDNKNVPINWIYKENIEDDEED